MKAMRHAFCAWCCAALALVACRGDRDLGGEAQARIAIAIERAAGDAANLAEVAFGEPFVVRVERSWPISMRASAFDERALAPLEIESIGVERTESAVSVNESRRYRAQAFVRDEVAIGPLRMIAVPSAGGAPIESRSEPLALIVRSSLRGDDDGKVEQPMALLQPPTRGSGALAALVATLAFVALMGIRFLRSQRRAAPTIEPQVAPSAPMRDARADALAAIAELERASSSDRDFAERLADALRAWAASVAGLRPTTMTTEELAIAFARRADARATQQLLAALAPCDLVKFACARADAATRSAVIQMARACLEASR